MAFTLAFEEHPGLRTALVPWDSELYGFPVYEVQPLGDDPASALAAWLAERPAPAFAYARLATHDLARAAALCRCGFYPAETTLDLAGSLARFTPLIARPARGARLRRATADDLPALTALARTAFACDRLHLDPHLDPAIADERFARWVARGVEADELVYLYEAVADGTLYGFFHARPSGEGGVDLSLAALAPTAQGMGVLLYQAVLEALRDAGYRVGLARVSMNNLPVVNLYLRAGFTVRAAQATYHWYRPAAG